MGIESRLMTHSQLANSTTTDAPTGATTRTLAFSAQSIKIFRPYPARKSRFVKRRAE